LARSCSQPLPSRGWPRSPVPFRARDGKGGFASVLIGKLGRGQGWNRGSFEKGCDRCTPGHQVLVVLGLVPAWALRRRPSGGTWPESVTSSFDGPVRGYNMLAQYRPGHHGVMDR
jgi:hypothetical protein